MCTYNIITMHSILLAICASNAIAFFWGSSEQTSPRPIQPYPVAAYYQRVFQVPQQANEEESVPVPAIPIQMPLQASLSPIPNLQNVQLVPCVCPIQPEFEYDKPIDSNNNKNNIYVAPH